MALIRLNQILFLHFLLACHHLSTVCGLNNIGILIFNTLSGINMLNLIN